MASKTLLGLTNYVMSGVISASAQTQELPASNLTNNICSPSTGWQTPQGALSNVTLRIDAPAKAQPWRVFGLFRTNLTPTATIIFTSWIQIGTAAASQVYSATVTGAARGTGMVLAVAPTTHTADYVIITITDSANADNFINVGGCFVGPAWIPTLGITWSSSYGRQVSSRQSRTRGGQVYQRINYTFRRWTIAMDGIAQSELWDGGVDEIIRVSATGQNVLFIPDITSSQINLNSVFGLLESQADIQFPAHNADRRSWRATIEERL